MADEFVWEPSEYHETESNLAQFIDEYDYDGADDLIPETEADLARFWGAAAEDTGVVWREDYDAVVDTSDGVEFADWYTGGRLNAVETILDQWVERTPDRAVYVWEDENGREATVTYADLAARTNRLANAMRDHGVERGDVVGVTFPMHPDGFAACLAALRIGAAFTMVFPGYGADAMGLRLDDAGAELVVAADGYVRGGETVDLLAKLDDAVAGAESVTDIVVRDHVGLDTPVSDATTHDWAGFVDGYDTDAETAVMDSGDPSFLAYSSGTTGAPKGTIHTHASLLVMGNKEVRYHFDLDEGDTLAWVTDFGWIIVPVWMLAGAPALGATTLLLEGAPDHPSGDRVWRAIEEHEVTAFGISPSGARGLRQSNETPGEDYDLGSLRAIGSTGEPWDEDGWQWFFEEVGGGEVPVINASGGTELAGAILVPTPLTPLKPATLAGPAPGVAANIYDENGEPADEGYLVIEQPIPGMTNSLTAGDERYLDEYWREFEGVWNQNDWAERDADGCWYITGRADDTMNVAGRRVTAPEIEEVIAGHPAVEEASVVPVPHDVKGEVPVAFVTRLDGGDGGGGGEGGESDDELAESVRERVATDLGAPYRPAAVHVVPALPRTQTGKIPRGVIEAVYRGQPAGNVSTLSDAHALEEFPQREK
jgi:acetyl-CoA synthetase